MDSQFPTFGRLSRMDFAGAFGWPWYTTAAQRRGLLRVIAVGIEEKLPLVPLLQAWAEDERGAQQKRLRRLLRLINAGATIADAVEQVPGILRDEDILALRFDSQSGTVTTAVREGLDDAANNAPARLSRSRGTSLYLWTVLILGCPIVTFIAIKIMPAFQMILREFDVR